MTRGMRDDGNLRFLMTPTMIKQDLVAVVETGSWRILNKMVAKGVHMRKDGEEGDDVASEEVVEADVEEWDDCDNEDDMQIVLDDEAPIYTAAERHVDGNVA